MTIAIWILIILSIFTILSILASLFLIAKEKEKHILDLTLREAFFQKRTFWTIILLLIIPSPILFGYYVWKIIRS